MFQEHLYQDLILAIGMVLILTLAAWYDANGAEVPDCVTIPYALCGMAMSVLHGRLTNAAVCACLLGLAVYSWRPKWLRRLDAWMMWRAYTEESLQEETEELEAKAEKFEARFGRRIKLSMKAIEVTILLGLGLICSVQGWTTQAVVALSALVVFMVCFWRLQARTETDEEEAMSEEVEELSAFGGADFIVLVGMLGFYGPITFLYCLTASFLVYIIMVILRNLVMRGKANRGMVMLPSLLAAVPIRIYLATEVCPQVVQAISWAAREAGEIGL